MKDNNEVKEYDTNYALAMLKHVAIISEIPAFEKECNDFIRDILTSEHTASNFARLCKEYDKLNDKFSHRGDLY